MAINGYNIPGKRGGIAVRKAAQIVLNNPGIKTDDILTEAAHFADLNLSTAGWIVNPKDGPVGTLWERRKEGRGFRHYPNAFTECAIGDLEGDVRAMVLKKFIGQNQHLFGTRPGDIIRSTHYGNILFLGMVIRNWKRSEVTATSFFPDITVESFNSVKDFPFEARSLPTLRFNCAHGIIDDMVGGEHFSKC